VVYYDVRKRIRNGDVLLWSPTTLAGRWIAYRLQSPFSHAGMACWAGRVGDSDSVLEHSEFLQWHGGWTTNLSCAIRAYPRGVCHVFRLAGIDGHHAAQCMRRRAGTPYAWRDLVRIRLRKLLPSLPCWDEECYTASFNRALVCSAAVADSARRGNVWVAAGVPVWAVTPHDLANYAEYKFTLCWDPEDAKRLEGQEFFRPIYDSEFPCQSTIPFRPRPLKSKPISSQENVP
jgi:hypothetical protein